MRGRECARGFLRRHGHGHASGHAHGSVSDHARDLNLKGLNVGADEGAGVSENDACHPHEHGYARVHDRLNGHDREGGCVGGLPSRKDSQCQLAGMGLSSQAGR